LLLTHLDVVAVLTELPAISAPPKIDILLMRRDGFSLDGKTISKLTQLFRLSRTGIA
jgi:hypothetical protein